MKKYLLLLLFISINILTFAQANWITKEVSNNLFTKFPYNPTYKINEKSATYTAKTKNCLFIVLIQFNIIPHFSDFKKLSTTEQTHLTEIFLNNYIEGKLDRTNNKNVILNSIQIGEYIGKQVSYNAINPATGERGERYSKTIVVNNNVFAFECWLLNTNPSALQEKDKFHNSITSDNVNSTQENSSETGLSKLVKQHLDPQRSIPDPSFIKDQQTPDKGLDSQKEPSLTPASKSQLKLKDFLDYVPDLMIDDPDLDKKLSIAKAAEQKELFIIYACFLGIILLVSLCIYFDKKNNISNSKKINPIVDDILQTSNQEFPILEQYKSLQNHGKFEFLIFCSYVTLQAKGHTNEIKSKYLRHLVNTRRDYDVNLPSGVTVDLINSRMSFYSDEFNILLKSNGNINSKYFKLFYESPLALIPSESNNLPEVIKFSIYFSQVIKNLTK